MMHSVLRRSWLALPLSCAIESGDGSPTASTSGETGSPPANSSEATAALSEAGASSDANATTELPSSTDDDGGSSTGDPYPDPLGPVCSVQEVTKGVLYDPLPRGESAGVFPTAIAEALEDYCGCHTLMSGNMNVGWPGLEAPGGSLFLDYADLARPYDGVTLGQAMLAEIDGYAMPPGSCSYPLEPRTLLADWFAQGTPDGASYVPPA